MFSFHKGVSWLTVHYMIGEVQYGGRVTDDFDKRLLNTYAHVWFTDSIFQDSFKFYIGYQIPKCTQIADFRAAIEELPLTDTPEVLFCHIYFCLFVIGVFFCLSVGLSVCRPVGLSVICLFVCLYLCLSNLKLPD